MHSLTALDSNQIEKVGIGAIVAVVVIGLLLGMIVTAIIGRIIILLVVVGLGAFIWQQRASIEDHVKNCNLHMTFFGYHIDAPADVIAQCRNVTHGK